MKNLLLKDLPAGATVGRWGGEEFVVLLPGQASRAALRTAEQVRSAVANQRFAVAEGLHLTCSIGVASFPDHAQDRDTLIRCADRAMYAAKSLGRNQVRLADDALVQALEDGVWRGPHEGRGTETVDVLVSVVAAREQAAGQHADRVGDLLLQSAHVLGIPTWQAHRIALAGRLHDVGKLAIPDGVLQKPGPLSRQEWTMMRTHPVLGAALIGHIPALQDLAPLIRSHHERWDGTGYPDGLVGETIPLGARLLSVVDAYMAMTEHRCYQRACVPARALTELRLQAGKQFDPQMVEILEQVLREREVSREKDPLS